jgi:hypothetical protein
VNYQQLIQFILRKSQKALWDNLSSSKQLPDHRTVNTIRALVSSPSAQAAIERGDDTIFAFALRAVDRVVSKQEVPAAGIISRLWDILDDPDLNLALGVKRKDRIQPLAKETALVRLIPLASSLPKLRSI